MRNVFYVLIVIWLLLLLSRTQGNIIIGLQYQTRILQGHTADLFNLQQQIDGTYVQGPLPKHYDETTPTPLGPRRLRKHIGQELKDN